MRASEFITEAKTEKLDPQFMANMPATYAIPELPNQDAYLQYRFAVAIAGAKGSLAGPDNNPMPMTREGPFSEDEVVVSFDPHVGDYVDAALKTMGLKGKKLITTAKSEEGPGTQKSSPIKGFQGFKS